MQNKFNAKKSFVTGVLLIFVAFLLAGCVTNRTTDPARTATEQLLLSTAMDHALRSANFMIFANRKVFLDTAYFDSYDSKYAIGAIRDALSRDGALLEENVTNSDIVIEARSGALSTDGSTYLFGLPGIGLPVPLAGVVQTPELAFYKSEKQTSTAKFALLAFARESRAHIYSSGPLDGKSYNNHYKLLFIAWVSTDIPEKQGNKKAAQYQAWFPQYDPANFPSTNAPAVNPRPANSFSTNNFPPASPVFTNALPASANTNMVEK
jgi:hypothetical protein